MVWYGIIYDSEKEKENSPPSTHSPTKHPLISNLHGQPIQLPLPIPMLRNLKSVIIKEILRPPDHPQPLPETLRLHICHSNNAIRVGNLARNRKLHPRNLASHLDEINSLARRADGFQVPVGFAHPVHGAALLLEGRDGLRAAGDEDAVEHGAAHALEVVVGLDARGAAGLVLAGGEDGGAARADGVRQGAGALERAEHGVVGDGVVAVGDEDGDAARLDRGDGGHEVGLAEALGCLAVVGTAFLLRDFVGTDELGDLLR